MKPTLAILTALLLVRLSPLHALDYPHVTAEPQKTGWPLTAEERAYVVEKPEHDRRPGRESNKHLPKLWPQVPSAGSEKGSGLFSWAESLVAWLLKPLAGAFSRSRIRFGRSFVVPPSGGECVGLPQGRTTNKPQARLAAF